VPGLDYCCGNCYLIRGRPAKAGESFEELLAKLLEYQPKILVLWCPTCFCLFETAFGEFTNYPFEIKSMAQYVSERLDRLEINQPLSCKVTVHDACKVALTGLDLVGSREVLRHLGAELVEMPRSAEKAACCGCSAIRHYPQVGYQMLEARIAEAAETGAIIMATVCHYCNQMLASRQEGAPFTVENYINLLASGMGVEREDKFRKYKAWADAERILEDAAPFLSQSPFSRELIESTVRTVFER
jgi:heterodisulfide reductase subunit B